MTDARSAPALVLGVLDQSPVPSGTSPDEAIRRSVELAVAAERLGYHRYWLAEHHGAAGLAGTAPEVLAARVAAATSSIRVGAGGVMLSHYSSLKVAEAFRVLHALFPGRIDLGVGRAPGAGPPATAALQAGPEAFGDDEFPRRLTDLLGFLAGGLPDDHPHAGVRAAPEGPGGPEVWMLGSSPFSAACAAGLGLPFCFAHFITAEHGARVMAGYRRQFLPSAVAGTPRGAVAVSVLCADTDAEARHLATSVHVWHLDHQDERGPVPSVAEARSRRTNYLEQALMAQDRARVVVGDPEQVRTELARLTRAFGVDEALVVTVCHDPAARLRSYELLAEAFGLHP